jgi:hypothetical protein
MSSAFAQSVPEPDPLSIRFVTEEDAEATRAIYNHEVTEPGSSDTVGHTRQSWQCAARR